MSPQPETDEPRTLDYGPSCLLTPATSRYRRLMRSRAVKSCWFAGTLLFVIAAVEFCLCWTFLRGANLVAFLGYATVCLDAAFGIVMWFCAYALGKHRHWARQLTVIFTCVAGAFYLLFFVVRIWFIKQAGGANAVAAVVDLVMLGVFFDIIVHASKSATGFRRPARGA